MEDYEEDEDDELTVRKGDLVMVALGGGGGWAFTGPNNDWAMVQKGSLSGLVPASILFRGVHPEVAYLSRAGKGRDGVSPLDRELAAKQNAKYDSLQEALCQHWIERATGHGFRKPFAQELKAGVVLCQLVEKIKPGCIKKIHIDSTVAL